ncbi:MAG: hypothetical protein U0791_20385 [Gemmataceae bacterium]
MRGRFIFCAISLSLLGTGCSTVVNAGHGTSYWTRQAMRDAHERKRNHRLAKDAWAEFQIAHPDVSGDFADGFRDGFADHLFRGTLQAPLLPPARYRDLSYQTSDGFRAGSDWLDGFQAGIADAQARGIRNWILGPTSLGGAALTERASVVQPPAIPLPVPSVVPPIGPNDRLPTPRAIEKTSWRELVLTQPETIRPPVRLAEPPSKFSTPPAARSMPQPAITQRVTPLGRLADVPPNLSPLPVEIPIPQPALAPSPRPLSPSAPRTLPLSMRDDSKLHAFQVEDPASLSLVVPASYSEPMPPLAIDVRTASAVVEVKWRAIGSVETVIWRAAKPEHRKGQP